MASSTQKTTTATTTPEPPQDEPKAAKGGDPTPERYYVLKAFVLADGQVVMPGSEWTPTPDFPSRRPKQLVEQKFLRPID